MTFADWVHETKVRFQKEPIDVALRKSVNRLYDGANSHAHWLFAQIFTDNIMRVQFGDANPKFRVYSREDVERANTAMREKDLLEWFIEPIGPEWTVWDIGSHHGTYAITCELLGASTVAFEPHPDNILRLRDNVLINECNTQVRTEALSNINGKTLFGGHSRLAQAGVSEIGSIEVRTIRGDDLQCQTPNAVKIDVEGHEYKVLSGMKDTLKDVDRIMIEVHENTRVKAIKEILGEAGLTTLKKKIDRSQTYIAGIRE
jgi:methyltransferase, FkbM family